MASRDLRWLGAPILTLLLAALMVLTIGYLISLLGGEPYKFLRLQVQLLAITGAFGGLIYGLIIAKGALHWTWLDPEQSFVFVAGILADALIGVGGAWGVFLVLGRTLRITDTPEDMLVLLGLGVVAGFGARTLLVTLSLRLEELARLKEEAKQEARQEAKAQRPSMTYYTASLAARNVVALFDASDPPARARFKGVLEQNATQMKDVIQESPQRTDAYLVLAVLKKRLALISPAERKASLEEAIDACTRALSVNDRLAAAYYNRACYKALAEQPVKDVAADLKRAIDLEPEFKAHARTDEDLAAYRDKADIAGLL